MLLGAAFGLSTLITPLYLVYQQQFGFLAEPPSRPSRIGAVEGIV
jgi:hypothetical protein